MNIDETVKALRKLHYDYSNYIPAEILLAAADQLERLNDFQNSQCMKLMEKIVVLESENERLKASQPVMCGECKYIRHDDEGYFCNVGLRHCYLGENDFCIFGERRDTE